MQAKLPFYDSRVPRSPLRELAVRIFLIVVAMLALAPVIGRADGTAVGARVQFFADEKLPADDFTKIANPKPATAKQQAKWNSAAEAFNNAHKALAEICKKRGLFEEGDYHTQITRAKPGKSSARANTAKPDDCRAYWKAAREKLGAAANKWMDYANAAKSEGNDAQYKAGVCQALKTCIDCEAARKARGEASIDGLGWLPEARVEALKKATREGLAQPEDVAAFDTQYAQAGAGYVLLTKHFAVCSTAKFAATAKLAEGFDPLYEAVAKLLGESAALTDERIGVFLYGTAAEFGQANAQREGVAWSGGFYRARSGLAHFPLYEGGAQAAANHELTHAIVDYALRGKPISSYDGPRGKQSAAAFFWIAEGMAEHFEGFKQDKPEEPLSALRGRDDALKARAKWCRDLDVIFALTAESWSKDDADVGGSYLAAAALTEFCLGAGKEKYAPCFMRLLRNHYTRELEVKDFDTAFGAKRADFEADYFKWFDEKTK